MRWRLGTELRSDSGVYSWTLPSGKVQEYTSVTSILREHFTGGYAFVQPYIVAQKAAELAHCMQTGEAVRLPDGYRLDEAGQMVRQYKSVHPFDALVDTEWLRYEGDRYLTKAANRGSVVHALLPLWEEGARMSQADIKYWVPDVIAERQYSCDEDETIGYALALNAFLHERQPVIRLSERPVFHQRLQVAGTMDGYWNFGDGYYLIDVKTSKAVRPGMAEQIAAYYFADLIGQPRDLPVATGIRRRMPRARGALILLVQPEGVTVRRVRNLYAAFESFCGIKRAWDYNHGSLFETWKHLTYKTPSTPSEAALNGE